MQQKHFLLILLIFVTSLLSAQNKSVFDLDFQQKANSSYEYDSPSSLFPEYGTKGDQIIELSATKGGFFTIGTTNGSTNSKLDDSCQITFGHPYAKTSYPYFKLNGTLFNIENYFYDKEVQLIKGEKYLSVFAEDESISVILNLELQEESGKAKISIKFINKGTTPINLTAGFVLDPALGMWGDGFAYENGTLVENSKIYTENIPTQFNIWERQSTPKGLGLGLDLTNTAAEKFYLGNWFDIYNSDLVVGSDLYDLAFCFEKTKTELQTNDSLVVEFNVSVLESDFPNGLFVRSQIPTFFSIENNQLFPLVTSTLAKVYNNSTNEYQNLNFAVEGGNIIESYELSAKFFLAGGKNVLKTISLTSREVFEKIVNPVTLKLLQNGSILDQIDRNILIPGSPISDTGLVVTLDTLIYANPQVKVGFHVLNENTGAIINKIRNENIFLYEDGLRVNDYVLEKDTTGGSNQVDIVFVLDVTGSMGEEIGGVKNNIIEFADSLSNQGVDFRLGMVTFLDAIENVYDFTSNAVQFKNYIAQQYSHGGDDTPENSLAALMRASEFNFRDEANRVVIWITDADYHILDWATNLTVQQVIDALLNKSIVTNCIGATYYQTQFYDPIVNATGGKFFDIYGNFRDILLELSHMPSSGKYLLTYDTYDAAILHNGKFELHYAGLGGNVLFSYGNGTKSIDENKTNDISCYPNPFNPIINIQLANPNLLGGEVEIFNSLGQKVKTLSFNPGQNPVVLQWNANNNNERVNATGVYFVRGSYYSANSSKVLPVKKVIYLK